MKRTEFLTSYYAGRRDFNGEDLRRQMFAGPVIRECTFRGADFTGSAISCRFEHCDLTSADLTDAHITGSFYDCCLDGVNLSDSQVAGYFERTTFTQAWLARTLFERTQFQECTLESVWANLTTFRHVSMLNTVVADALMDGVSFIDSDLASFAEAPCMRLGFDPVAVDWRSVCRTVWSSALGNFLAECGLPEIAVLYLIDCARAEDAQFLKKVMRSTFISYGGPDEDFARALRDDLQRNGVKTFFFKTDALPGKRLHDVMWDGVNNYDRVILICSEVSLRRPGVRYELEETLAREARDGGESYLIPVTLDNFIFRWNDPTALKLRGRVVADFSEVRVAPKKYSEVLQSLLRALRRNDLGA